MKLEVLAYSITEGHPNWLIRCPHCGKIHAHGAGGEGPRSPHCLSTKPYALKYAGPAPVEMLREKYGAGWMWTVRAGLISLRDRAIWRKVWRALLAGDPDPRAAREPSEGRWPRPPARWKIPVPPQSTPPTPSHHIEG